MRKKFLICLAVGLFIVIGLLSVGWQEFEPLREMLDGRATREAVQVVEEIAPEGGME